jgi:hypothetical protein
MRLVAYLIQPRTAPALATAVFLASTTFANPSSAASVAEAQVPAYVVRIATHDPIDTRINDLHTKLQITSAQEELWQKVAQVMRDNASAIDSLRQARTRNANSMNAVDDLKSYGEIADAHADGIRKLTPVFQTLYDSMSETQKRNADLIFRTRQHHASKRN